MHPNATACTHTTAVAIITISVTSTATKAWATTINSSAITATAIKIKDIKAKNLGYKKRYETIYIQRAGSDSVHVSPWKFLESSSFMPFGILVKGVTIVALILLLIN